jgi:hypothetical protein
MTAVLLSQKARMIQAEVMPFLPKNSHDICASVRMLFTFRTIHVWLSEVSDIVNKKGNP